MTPDPVPPRSFLVTGANSGIGRALAEALAARGDRVILAARSAERTTPVVDAIRGRTPGARVSFLHLDLADFGSIRQAADEVLASGEGLDVLVNNAGVAGTADLSRDGFDRTYATNHLGPFLLTRLLLPTLQRSSEARVVNVASVAHLQVREIDWTLLERRATPRRSGFRDYAVTKLMNVIHARELARRLAGTTVRTCSLHPGGVATNIWRALPGPLQWVLKLFLLSNEEGARTPLYCATSPDLRDVSGRYYARCREARANPLADRPELADELWARSEAAIG
jgi:retinol dehydrogenase 12